MRNWAVDAYGESLFYYRITLDIFRFLFYNVDT